MIDTGYACAVIEVKEDIVVKAAPIYRWMIGKHEEQVFSWKNIKQVEVVEID